MEPIIKLMYELHCQGRSFNLSNVASSTELKLGLDNWLEVNNKTGVSLQIKRFGTLLFETEKMESAMEYINWFLKKEEDEQIVESVEGLLKDEDE